MIKEAKLMAEYKDANVIKVQPAETFVVSEPSLNLQFYGVACDRPPLMILMELCAGGSLDNHLRNRGKNISDTEKFVYLYEVSCPLLGRYDICAQCKGPSWNGGANNRWYGCKNCALNRKSWMRFTVISSIESANNCSVCLQPTSL